MLKAIFFDNDGVISGNGFVTAVAQYEQENNIPSGEFYKVVHDLPAWQDFSLGLISETEYLDRCRANNPNGYPFKTERYLELLDMSDAVNVEVVALIKELSPKYILGIVSNYPKEWFERFLSKTGLGVYLKVQAFSGKLHVRKPSKEIFQAALDMAGVSGSEAVYIDDRPERVDGAKELGIKVIMFDGDVNKLKQTLISF